MWEKICNIFERKSAAQVTMLQRKLHNLKLNSDQKVSDYVAEARNLAAQLENAGDRGISDYMLQTIIVEKLPSVKYSGFLFGWNSKPKMNKTLLNLEMELITAEELISTQDEEVTAMTSTAHKGKIQKKSTDKNNKRKFDGQCFHCKKTGYKKFECRIFKKENEREEKKKGGAHNKNTKTKQTDEEENETEDAVFFARAYIAESNVAEDEQTWLADSGASYHMAYDKSIFENLRKAEMYKIRR